mgnify:CR=1 FL=1
MENRIELPLTAEKVDDLHAGDTVKLSGIIYTARDAAHKRLVAALDANEPLPVELQNATIYFAGPCPAPPGRPIGSAGPTTSGRMDAYSPRIIRECGLRAMIGKGDRNDAVKSVYRQVLQYVRRMARHQRPHCGRKRKHDGLRERRERPLSSRLREVDAQF